MIEEKYPNCTYSTTGCRFPGNCEKCGFDKNEKKRRAQIPLTEGGDGKRRKYLGLRHREEQEP